MSKQPKYDKEYVMSITFVIFVVSTVIAIFSFSNPFATLSGLSGMLFAGFYISEMLE